MSTDTQAHFADLAVAPLIAGLAPQGSIALAQEIRGTPPAISPQEEQLVARAVPKRRLEFAFGRSVARRALARLGVFCGSLGADAVGVPLWPEGTSGSLTHGAGLAAALVTASAGPALVGIDVEEASRLTGDVARLIASESEARRASAAAPSGVDWSAALLFSAKESFYKAYFPVVRRFLEFADVVIEVDWAAARFEGRLVNPDCPSVLGRRALEGRFGSTGGRVFTAIVEEAKSEAVDLLGSRHRRLQALRQTPR